jgi:peptide/nickel transport system substrate-binding protein
MPRHARSTAATALVVVAGLGLAGCAAPTDDGDGGTVTFAIEGANLSNGKMDPHSTQLDSSALVLRNVFDSLVAQNADGSFSPWLAESWEPSDDGLSYTFTLRDDVSFSDGEALDAEVVKANIDHVIDPGTVSAKAASLIGYNTEDPEGSAFQEAVVVDERTIRFDFARPFAPFLSGLATPFLGVYSPASLELEQADLAAGGPEATVGSGPFVLSEYVPDQELVLERNADYGWAPEGAEIGTAQTLDIRILPEASVRNGALTSGEAQVIADVLPTDVDQLGDAETEVWELPGVPYSLYLNVNRGALTDVRVREAVARGIDVEADVESVYGEGYPRAWSALTSTTPGYDAALEDSWPFDAEAAEALLEEAGWTGTDAEGFRTKDGERLSVEWVAWTPQPDDAAALADLIQQDLADIGVELVRSVVEPAAYNALYGPKEIDVTDWSFAGTGGEVLANHLQTGGFQNASAVSDPALDAILDEAAASTDAAEQAALYEQVQQWNAEQWAIVPLYAPTRITASSSDVEGLSYDIYGRPLFLGVSV